MGKEAMNSDLCKIARTGRINGSVAATKKRRKALSSIKKNQPAMARISISVWMAEIIQYARYEIKAMRAVKGENSFRDGGRKSPHIGTRAA